MNSESFGAEETSLGCLSRNCPFLGILKLQGALESFERLGDAGHSSTLTHTELDKKFQVQGTTLNTLRLILHCLPSSDVAAEDLVSLVPAPSG